MLTDEVEIRIKAGKGGNGAVSFRREKYIPKGGPDGGDGGDGGDLFFRVNPSVNTLTFFNMKKEFQADNGDQGGKNQRHGKDGEDLYLDVPPGTIVYEIKKIDKDDEKSEIVYEKIADLTVIGEEFRAAKGGRGGWGNVHFASATHQTPYEANPGTPGQEKLIKLELDLIADVGIIGLPNSGKSTLLSRISNARPKIANYPFTTLEPNLGMVRVDEKTTFVAADIPGLIEGASIGKGLGHKFLKHILRTKTLLHIIDINSDDPVRDYKTIKNELKTFSPELAKKKEVISFNKIETVSSEKVEEVIKKFKTKTKKTPLAFSAVTGTGIKEILYKIKKVLSK